MLHILAFASNIADIIIGLSRTLGTQYINYVAYTTYCMTPQCILPPHHGRRGRTAVRDARAGLSGPSAMATNVSASHQSGAPRVVPEARCAGSCRVLDVRRADRDDEPGHEKSRHRHLAMRPLECGAHEPHTYLHAPHKPAHDRSVVASSGCSSSGTANKSGSVGTFPTGRGVTDVTRHV